MLVSDSAIRRLNRDFRAKDQPTDVLSFPQLSEFGVPPTSAKLIATNAPPLALGDVVILEAVFEHLLNWLKEKTGNDEAALAEMLAISSRPKMYTTIRFGKYRGKTVDENRSTPCFRQVPADNHAGFENGSSIVVLRVPNETLHRFNGGLLLGGVPAKGRKILKKVQNAPLCRSAASMANVLEDDDQRRRK